MSKTIVSGFNKVEIDWVKSNALVSPLPVLRWIVTLSRYSRFEGIDMSIKITDNQRFVVAVVAVDVKGNPASIEGVPTWTVSDQSLLAIEPVVDNPLAVTVTALGPLGAAQVIVAADADLGEGTTLIGGLLDVEIVSGAAVSLALSPGIPFEQ